MDTGQQVLVGSGLMDLCRHFPILGGGRGEVALHSFAGNASVFRGPTAAGRTSHTSDAPPLPSGSNPPSHPAAPCPRSVASATGSLVRPLPLRSPERSLSSALFSARSFPVRLAVLHLRGSHLRTSFPSVLFRFHPFVSSPACFSPILPSFSPLQDPVGEWHKRQEL